jgi:hypothetical protein
MTTKKKPAFIATLVSGKRYHFLSPTDDRKKPDEFIFERGKPVAVTAAVKEALEQSAWEEVTIQTGHEITTEVRDKFEFTALQDGDELPEVSTGIRHRPTKPKPK